MMKGKLIFLFMMSLVAFTYAQQQEVNGTVIDENGLPIAGANVIVKESSSGTITDFDGNYSISVAEGNTIDFSFIGFKTETILFTGQPEINVTLQESASSLDEVIVTSLGIKKEKRALGYSASELSSESIVRVRTNNVLDALSGQISGVQITGGNNGLASSSRIIIRGENSLNINGNQPLFVLDGVPVNNKIFGVGGSPIDQRDLPTDYGNGLSDLNPDDFESITVLKGAAASALYGTRAANGVVVITTKKGKKKDDGIGLEISSSTTFSDQMDLLDIQDQYGGGWAGSYVSDYGTNYGPALDGSIVNQELTLNEYVERPFINRYDLNDFFKTGVNRFNSFAMSGANDNGHFRLSYANTNNDGFIPNTNLKGDSFSLNAGYQLTDKWKVNGLANYITRGSDNLPVAGYGSQGLMYALLWNYLNVDLNDFREYWTTKNVEQRKLFNWADNPWFIVNENINGFDKNRFIGIASSTYQITENLSLLTRVGIDKSDDLRMSRRAVGSQRFPNGMYREQTIDFSEVNADFLLTYDKKFNAFETSISVGGNRFDQKIEERFIQGNSLAIPELYNAQNIDVNPVVKTEIFNKRINSLYGFANISYNNFLFLELSARNDWSSTLPIDNNSFFYPAASFSFIPSTAFELPNAIDFLKLRFNIAEVGKDTDPYNLINAYEFGTLNGTLTNASQVLNSNLRPERTVSTEVGLDTHFFKKRISLDATYYSATSRDQILNFGISGASGFNSTITNAGEIKNSGFEVGLGVVPIRSENFEWKMNANFTRNRSEVISLSQGLDTFIIAQGVPGVTVEARPGEQMGDIYGQVYQRSDNGEIIYQNGLPLTSGERQKVGNYNPDYMLGLSSSLQWKNFNFNVLLDIREGGEIYSYTNAIGRESGTLAFTLPWRDGVIGEGVMDDGNGNFVPNTTEVTAEGWAYAVPRSNAEANVFDASYMKLRQLSLGYTFDKDLIKSFGFQELSLSLIGSNLLIWSDVPNIDPESQSLSGGTLLPGFEITQLPSTRNYGFKIDIKF